MLFVEERQVLRSQRLVNRAGGPVSPDGPHLDEVRYIPHPFMTTEFGSFAAAGITGEWPETWTSGMAPF